MHLLFGMTLYKHRRLRLDLDVLYNELFREDYVVILKLHPAVTMKQNYEQQYPGFVYQLDANLHVNELMLVADLLVTDYSSIPYEFSFLNKPMLFFAYDLAQYTQQRGFWEDYETSSPGPIVKTTEELVEKIHAADFCLEKIAPFNLKWNEYSNGQSSENLVDFLFKE